MDDFGTACKREIERLEQQITKIGATMLERGGEAREWALTHHPAQYYRNRVERGELIDVSELITVENCRVCDNTGWVPGNSMGDPSTACRHCGRGRTLGDLVR